MTNRDDNIILAKFIGRKGKYRKDLYWYYDRRTSVSWHTADDLLFDRSWDWLMDIVEKINRTVVDGNACRVTIRINATLTEKVGKTDWEAINICTGEDVLSNTFKAVVSFVKTYNRIYEKDHFKNKHLL